MSLTALQRDAYYIAPRIAASLSVVGSTIIFVDLVALRRKTMLTRHRLLFGMSLCDIMSSSSIFVWSWAVPAEDSPDPSRNHGTWGTCQAQGFFTQLFVGTMAYNATLAFYYFLVIHRGVSETAITRYHESYLHGIPLLLGFGTASASVGLGLINPVGASQCWIVKYPIYCDPNANATEGGTSVPCERGENADLYRLLFFFIPLVASLLFVTILMILMYYRFRKLERASDHFRTPTASQWPGQQTRRFGRQALLYVGAFYITWFFTVLNRILMETTSFSSTTIDLNIVAASLMPLQGFWNAIIYCTPRCCTRRTGGTRGTVSGVVVRRRTSMFRLRPSPLCSLSSSVERDQDAPVAPDPISPAPIIPPGSSFNKDYVSSKKKDVAADDDGEELRQEQPVEE